MKRYNTFITQTKEDIMSIIFDSVNKVFTIETKDLSYLMQITHQGYLLHTYYGKKISDSYIPHASIDYPQASFSPNPANEPNKRFTLDTKPQEYSCIQTGDYRISSLELINSNGEFASELKYISHDIIHGKPVLTELPSIFANDEVATTLIITCIDEYAQTEVKLHYSVFEGQNVIIRSTKIKNLGNKPIHLKKVASSCVDYYVSDYDLIQLYGTWSKECNVERTNIAQGIHTISSRRGSTGHQHNPFAILADKTTTETHGEAFGFNLIYSGNFAIEIERDYMDNIRVVCGINSFGFDYELESNQEFQTPEVVMAYSCNGIGDLSRTYHNLYRNNICKSKWTNKKRPLLINTWEAAYFNFTEQTILDYAKSAKELGIELLVMDDGWFGKRNDDSSSLGDWYVNEEKLKGGLPKLVSEINEIGMDFGIWYEPEMISPKSDLYEKHPDWCIHMKERPNCIARNQYVLNLAKKEVRDYLFEEMSKVLSSCNIIYVKWDFNRNLTNVAMEELPEGKKGEVFHRYVLGLYELLERLTDAFPDILFEGCSGGGGRFDPAMLRYFPQIWTSDDTDAVERVQIQYGTSMAYPTSTMGSHVSDCPNHQTGRTTPLAMRSAVAMHGTYGFELNPLTLTEEESNYVKEEIGHYHAYYDLIQNGDLYRLTNPFTNLYYCATQIVSKDKSESLITYVVTRGRCLKPIMVKLQGLDPSAQYKDSNTGACYYGDTLMNLGVNFSENVKEGDSVRIHLQRI